MERKLTRKIMVGGVPVGGGAPVSIQSMLNTRTTDVDGCLAQIRALAAAGCEIARLAVAGMGAAWGVGACTGAGALAAQLLPELESDPAGLLLRAAVFSGVFILAACLSGTAERCLPPSLRGLLYLPERSEKTQAVR